MFPLAHYRVSLTHTRVAHAGRPSLVATANGRVADWPSSAGTGKLVGQDPDNGWTFGANPQEIVLTGDECKLMSSGDPVDVQILFGCPGQKDFPQTIY